MARILVVDDSPDTLHLVSATLESAGHTVFGVTDPLGALGLVRSEPLDAAVLDIMMPGLSGWELLESIRREPGQERLPIVFLSAIGDAGNRTRGIRLGADDFLAKPFDPEELLVRLERLIARSAMPSAGLQGELESHPLVEVLQGLEQNSKTGSLEVVAGARHGTILFATGKIVDAEFAGYRDRTAVLALLEHRRGYFRFVPGPVEAGRLRLEPSALLIEAAWVEDELTARRHLLPAPDQPMALHSPLPAVPKGLQGLPILELGAVLESAPEKTLARLLEDRRYAPPIVRLTVAWLIQIGALSTPEPQGPHDPRDRLGARELAERTLERFSQAAQARPGTLPEIAMIVHAPAWESVVPILRTVPEDLLGAQGSEARREIWRRRGGALNLEHGQERVRLTLGSFHRPEGAIDGEALAGVSAIVLWVSEELDFDDLERLLREIEGAAPATSRLIVVGTLGALARGGRWRNLPTPPESIEELLYELVEARG